MKDDEEKDTQRMREIFMNVSDRLHLPIGHEDGYNIDDLTQIITDLKYTTQDYVSNQ